MRTVSGSLCWDLALGAHEYVMREERSSLHTLILLNIISAIDLIWSTHMYNDVTLLSCACTRVGVHKN